MVIRELKENDLDFLLEIRNHESTRENLEKNYCIPYLNYIKNYDI